MTMHWRGRPLHPAQASAVEDAIGFARSHGEGLPRDLFVRLEQLLERGSIRTQTMPDRARWFGFPGMRSWIALNPQSLGLDQLYDHKKALESCTGRGEERALRERLILAKAEQQHLYLAAALVHEGTHELRGLSFWRRDDEKAAYEAECCFLANAYHANDSQLVKNAASSLYNDAIRDAREIEKVTLDLPL